MKKLIAGNWKMNLDRAGAAGLVRAIADGYGAEIAAVADLAVCPPFVYVPQVCNVLADTGIAVGAQDCSAEENGAHTGDISAKMLAETGCAYVIVGHSERRQNHGESDALVRAKAQKAHAQGLIPIICVGETEAEREAGLEKDVVGRQLLDSLPAGASAQNAVIAYEPVWAIGTGKTASPEDVRDMHAFIREKLGGRVADFQNMRILYGGSMKPENARDLLLTPNVDGGLIGGAALEAEKFLAIARAAL